MDEAKTKLKHVLNIDINTCVPITNGKLVEIYTKVSQCDSCTLSDLALATSFDCYRLRKKVFNIRKESKKLRGEAKKDFLQQTFKLSDSSETARPSTSGELKNIVEQSKVEVLSKTIEDLNRNITQIQTSNETLKKENDMLKKHRQLVVRQNKGLALVIQNKRKKYNTLRSKLKHSTLKASNNIKKAIKYMKEAGTLKTNVQELQKEVKTLKKDLAVSEKEKQDLKRVIEESRTKESVKIEFEETSLVQENKKLKESLSYVENLLQDENSNVIDTLNADNTYSSETTLCVMNLLSEGVGVHHVNNVLTHVANMCGKTLSTLPSISTINRMGDQRVSLSYKHFSEELTQKADTTLQSDETRKHGDVYEVYSVRDNDAKEWVLGLRDMADKSSATCLETLKAITADISECTYTDAGKKILTNIKNTMSDRALTEKKFHKLLESYREELLPAIYSNWGNLSDAEQETLSRLNNFYCGLHILVNFAEVSDGIIKRFEASTKEGPLGAEGYTETANFTKKEESGAVRLVRTASKCLARGGDDKSGCYVDFKTFLTDKYPKKSLKGSHLLVPFRGNRFNILFYNSEVIFYLADDIKEFFEKVNKPSNRLQKAVAYDISEQKYLATLKALGLCSKIVTGPFWRCLESKDCSLEIANEVYQQLHSFLDTAKDDCTDVLCGTYVPFPDSINQDKIYERLTTPDVYDGETCAILQQIFSSWYTLLIKAASDHLCCGAFADVDKRPTLASETKSVPRHNKFPERVFALLDALTRFRPIASTLCNEGYIMFSLNKTGEWLNSLPAEKRELYLDQSRKEGRTARQKYKERLSVIEEKRIETLREKRQQIRKKEEDQYRQREQLTNDILYYGLWQFPETVDQNMAELGTDTCKKKAIKAQLMFRKVVLGQKADKKLFQFSEKGSQYSLETLIENLKTLIRQALDSTPTSSDNSIFLGKKVRHYQIHKGVRVPYLGRVISPVPGYPQWLNVIYNDDPAVYVYKLAEDYAAGDLEIIAEGSKRQPALVQIVQLQLRLYLLTLETRPNILLEVQSLKFYSILFINADFIL